MTTTTTPAAYRYRTTTLARLQARGYRPFRVSVDALRDGMEDGATRTVWERTGYVRGSIAYHSTLLRRVGNDLHVITAPDARNAVMVFPGGQGRTVDTVTA